MKFLVEGVCTATHRVITGIEIEAPNIKAVYRSPEYHGFLRITKVQEIRDNTRRRNGRHFKRSQSELN